MDWGNNIASDYVASDGFGELVPVNDTKMLILLPEVNLGSTGSA